MNISKKLVSVLVIFALVFSVCSFSAFAIIHNDGNFYYEINAYTEEATVVGYLNNSKDVVIPAYYLDYPVTKVDDNAFLENSIITSLSFADNSNVKSIGDRAFAYCTSLKSVSLSSSITSMGREVFSNCGALTTANFNATVTEIPDNTFYACSSLTTVSIADSPVTSVGSSAFSDCTSLADFDTLNLTSIGRNAFYNTAFKTVRLGENLTNVADFAFGGCSNLESVFVDSTTIQFSDNTFYDSDLGLTIYCRLNSSAYEYATSNNLDAGIIGDADGDGYITIQDVTTIQKHCAFIQVLSEKGVNCANVSGDDVVTIRDATNVQFYLARLISKL